MHSRIGVPGILPVCISDFYDTAAVGCGVCVGPHTAVEMADNSHSYYRLHSEFVKRTDYDVVFREALNDLAGKVDISWVRSCVSFGTGSGEREMDLVQRLLPNLRAFHAVEPDAESAAALRVEFQSGRLRGVETTVVETSLESWSGVDTPLDAVLLISMLPHVHAADRKALLQQLRTEYLSPEGVVVICDNVCSVRSVYVLVMERLGWPRVDFDVLQNEILEAGFRPVASSDLNISRDWCNPHSDDLVRFIRMLTNYERSEHEVIAAIDDVEFTHPNMTFLPKTLAIFAK